MTNPDKVTIFKQNTVGIIGGMSWESSAMYYRLINQYVAQHLGAYIQPTSCCIAWILGRSGSL